MITPSYPPRAGGLETYVSSLSRALVKQGHQIAVLTNADSYEQPSTSMEGGVLTIRTPGLLDGLGHTNYVPWELAYFGLLTDIAQLVERYKFDVLHCHTQVGLLIAHLSGLAQAVPVVASFHETDPLRDPRGKQRTTFIMGACPANIYLTGSTVFTRQAETFGLPQEKIRLVPMGIEIRNRLHRDQARQQLADQYGIDPTKTMITLLGRFTRRKEHRRLLTAVAAMCYRPAVSVVLAGSDTSTEETYVEQLRRDIAQHSATDAHMIENLSDIDRNLLVDGTDIGTLPSSAEGLGLAALEFTMVGTPIVVSDIPGLREAVSNDRSALVQTDDPEEYAAALDQLARDPRLRRARGHRMAREARRSFTIERAAASTAKIYALACKTP